ncbi:MAG: hypothetical protein AAFU70_11035, partial [Planctomycetota bacterium]
MEPICQLDPELKRHELEGFEFPLGVYPVEAMTPAPGYRSEFEPADGDDDDGKWEHWPDRYVYDAVVSAERVQAFTVAALTMMPRRVFPILDFLGHDAYREIDPYIAYEPCGIDEILEATERFGPFFFEDGMCGFGAMSDEPFAYLFLDEHKILTIRVEPDLREKVERLLRAFDLAAVPEPSGADAAAHEHRGVLLAPADRPELMSGEEIVERLRDDWRLSLNIDPEGNVDDGGQVLGATGWRCLMRFPREAAVDAYAELYLIASSLNEAELLCLAES